MFSQSLLHENHELKTAHFVKRKKHDISQFENRVKNKIDSFFYLLLLGLRKLVKLKQLPGKNYTMQFKFYKSSLVFWYLGLKRFVLLLFLKKPSEVQTSNVNWRRKLGGG